jgi:LDH2 family malate/lactate/ureidoglycolate dehydrogenase
MPASYETHRKQLELILRSWGMEEATAASTAEIMSWADLHGIDTHGISMVPVYDQRRRDGKIDMRAEPTIAKETPVSALVDGGGGLGHANARRAMELAIEKARTVGIGVAVVRNSAHFGACGFYALMAVEAGLIGMVATSASGIQVAPTHGAQAKLGTDPIAFGAPGKPGEPFLLDMATTTVAAGKVKVYKLNHKPLPAGWVVDADGKTVTDEREAFGYVFEKKDGGITPLGGSRDVGSHKGYGLGVMVHILAGTLAGASFSPIRNKTQKPSDPHDIGHWFMAIDPRAFRDEGAFEDDLDQVIDILHATRRADPHQPVLVAGDPSSRACPFRTTSWTSFVRSWSEPGFRSCWQRKERLDEALRSHGRAARDQRAARFTADHAAGQAGRHPRQRQGERGDADARGGEGAAGALRRRRDHQAGETGGRSAQARGAGRPRAGGFRARRQR